LNVKLRIPSEATVSDSDCGLPASETGHTSVSFQKSITGSGWYRFLVVYPIRCVIENTHPKLISSLLRFYYSWSVARTTKNAQHTQKIDEEIKEEIVELKS